MSTDLSISGSARVPEQTRTLAEISFLSFAVLAFGMLAVWLGQSNNWDLRNYHLYNGWAWLTDREALDLAAAHAQTWFNPLLPAGLYLLFTSLPAWLSTFAMGCLQGLNLVPLHAIVRQLLPQALTRNRPCVPMLVALTGTLGATQLGELGASFGDTLVSLPMLGAIALLIGNGRLPTGRVLTAGALLGIAVGLKLTAAPIALGIAVAVPSLAQSPRVALRIVAICAAGAISAFLICDGWWMWHLWTHYANPLFPMFGHWFGGDYAPPVELSDARYLPKTPLQWLAYPLVWAKHPRIVSELWFLDLRVPLLFLGLLALPCWYRRAAQQAAPRTLRFVIVALSTAYLAWLALFGYYRYLALLEMLAPCLLSCAIAAAYGNARARTRYIVAGLCTLLVMTTKPPDWGRLPHFGSRFLDISVPELPGLATATVLLVDSEPLAYLALGFPPTTRFVRIGGSLLGPPLPEWRLDSEARKRIANRPGSLYAMFADPASANLPATLNRHQLHFLDSTCKRVGSSLQATGQSVHLCEVQVR